MKHILFIFLLTFFIGYSIISCTPEEQKFAFDTSLNLRFSEDTVLFDTVFTSVGSTTKRLKVFNDNPNALNISFIRTTNVNSPFSLIINGVESNEFEDLRLLGKDSMLILVEILIDPRDQDLPFIVEDLLQFETNTNEQSVNLVAWGQDANFLRDSILACNTSWLADRPYVIYNSILVDSLCLLTIEPGTRIYSHPGSSIYIKGTIDAQGDPGSRIYFGNDRLDEGYRDAPGQWEGIYFLEGSTGNVIRYADIRNANIGIWLGTPDNDTIPDLELDGVVIENMARSGLLGFTSDLLMTNTLVNNCVEYCVGNFAGGNYLYHNCTFGNYSTGFFRETPLFAVSDNLVLADQSVLVDDINLQLVNTIIWGDYPNEIILNNEGNAVFTALIAYSILKTTDQELDINSNILNSDPLFIDPEQFNFRLDSLSPAIDAGLATGIDLDLDGNIRDTIPDIGAYEWVPGNN